MDKFLPLPDEEKKKMQPWKAAPVKYPQVGAVRQPCTIPDKSPEEPQDEKVDGDGAAGREEPPKEEQPPSGDGAHFSFEKPAKQETDAPAGAKEEVDQWFDIV